MAAPPDLSSIPPTNTFSFQPLGDHHYTAMDGSLLDGNVQIPPLAPTPPGDMGPPTPIIPSLPEALQERRRSTDQARSRSDTPRPSLSRSRSRSPSRSSHHSASDDAESEHEDSQDPRYQWRPMVEDKSEPCEDEMVYIESRAATEHSATEETFFEEQTFFELDDKNLKALSSGRIEWLIERFNGTKEEPNKEQVMRSPIVSVGGYDWRIVFYPKGNSTEFLSLYLECVTMQKPEFAEFETFEQPPFPFLAGENTDTIKKRRSVAAQISVVMYNPAEPRTYDFKMDAHRYSKHSADYGWRYLAHRDEFHMRRHGQRQALLRNDTLAFKAYIRVIDDPTSCIWAHDNSERFKDSLLTSSLRPFAGQLPHLAALIPLLHFQPFRALITQHRDVTNTVYKLQTLLWKLYSRTHSVGYGRRPENVETTDAVSRLRAVRDALGKEVDEDVLGKLLGSLDPEKGALVSSNRLQTKTCSSIQEAINKHATPIATPVLLAVELQRQGFDPVARKWSKLTNRVEVDQFLTVDTQLYELYSVATHCGDLHSNKHNVYIKPSSRDIRWYAYEDRRVTAKTHKGAVEDHEGVDSNGAEKDKRRDSPCSHTSDLAEGEVIYVAMYVRHDFHPQHNLLAKEEAWDVPEDIRKGLDLPKQKESKRALTEAEEAADMPFRVEQDRFEQELRDNEAMQAALGPSTPDWPLTDEEGDTVMSDAEDDPPPHASQTPDMTASLTLTHIPTKPSICRKWHATIDSLGHDYYRGSMFGDKYQGQGHLVSMSGDEYIGAFYQGKQEGHGKMVYALTGNVYEGQWLAGQHHGHGTLTEVATGNVFEGGWREGKKHGQFVLRGLVTEEDRGLCTICYEREMTTAFYDCGHVLACRECAARIDNCPICRRRVVGRLQLFGVKMTLE
ncbi:hypothetical protein LTR02_003484 [Friedmanniomyces endolithicus]|nr:hypothetical protein LTR02_003484 [Friedmanniomyces endolithicus]